MLNQSFLLFFQTSCRANKITRHFASKGLIGLFTLLASLSVCAQTKEIVFIESNVADVQQLKNGMPPDAEVYLLDVGHNGLQQIGKVVAGRTEIAAIHIISHGFAGSVELGSVTLNAQNLDRHKVNLTTIGNALSEDADILLYGCNVAAGREGAAFITALAQATQANVAASNDLTGAAAKGGNWILENAIGQIDKDSLAFFSYRDVLAIRTWTGLAGPGLNSSSWTNSANWAGGPAPGAGDDLVFPAGALRLTNENNYPSGTAFNSITIQDAGYAITGNSVEFPDITSTHITATYASGTSTFGLPMTVANGNIYVDVANGGTLVFSGIVSGSGAGITKIGTGTLQLSNANSYDGVTTVNAGTLAITNNTGLGSTAGGTIVASGATLQLSGGITSSDALTVSGSGAGSQGVIVNSSGTNTLNGDITLSAGSIISAATSTSLLIDATISDNVSIFGVTKTGAGTLHLNAINSYDGTTSIITGLLNVDGSIPNMATVFVSTGAQLSGNGTVGNIASSGGTVGASSSSTANTLSTSNLSFDSATTFSAQLRGTTPGGANGYDQLNVTGTVSLGSATFSLTDNGFARSFGNQFTLIDNDSTDAIVGAFSGLPENTIFSIGSESFRISYTGGTGNDVVLTVVTPDLVLTKESVGNIIFGTAGGAYTLTVSNSGGDTNGSTVTVIDTLPPGLTVANVAADVTGTGWACVGNLPALATIVTCTRTDILADNASYPPIILLVDVDNAAPDPVTDLVTNTANVAGGGEVDTSNNSGNDTSIVHIFIDGFDGT